MTIPRPSRPATAMNVMRATANPARTMADLRLEQRDLVHDEADLGHQSEREGDRDRPERRLAHQLSARDMPSICGRRLRSKRSSFRPSAGPAVGGGPIQAMTTGTRTATMIAAAVSIAAWKPTCSTSSTSNGRNDDPTRARAGEGKADGEAATLHEPQAHDGRDDDRAHADPAERHQHERRVEQPRRGREREQRHRPGKAAIPSSTRRFRPSRVHELAGEGRRAHCRSGGKACWRPRSARPASH